MKVSTPRSTICFLILPRVHLMDLSGPVQVFYEANNLAPGSYDIQFAGVNDQDCREDRQPVWIRECASASKVTKQALCLSL